MHKDGFQFPYGFDSPDSGGFHKSLGGFFQNQSGGVGFVKRSAHGNSALSFYQAGVPALKLFQYLNGVKIACRPYRRPYNLGKVVQQRGVVTPVSATTELNFKELMITAFISFFWGENALRHQSFAVRRLIKPNSRHLVIAGRSDINLFSPFKIIVAFLSYFQNKL